MKRETLTVVLAAGEDTILLNTPDHGLRENDRFEIVTPDGRDYTFRVFDIAGNILVPKSEFGSRACDLSKIPPASMLCRNGWWSGWYKFGLYDTDIAEQMVRFGIERFTLPCKREYHGRR